MDSFERLTVLIVDDNQHMRTLVSAILQSFGVKQVFDADSAPEAWTILKENRCDIVFVDWIMKGGNGIELARKIRTAADSPDPCMPIVMLTGHTNAERVRAARDAGVNAFLAKPVSAQAILARLVSVIENPRPFIMADTYVGPCRRRRSDENYQGPERRRQESASEKPASAA